jgi:hypothetical protein
MLRERERTQDFNRSRQKNSTPSELTSAKLCRFIEQ